MCGEVFSSKFTPEYKARVDQPPSLALPGRWVCVFKPAGAKKPTEYTAGTDPRGYATEADAKAAVRRALGSSGSGHSSHSILPPAEQFGDHNAAALSHDQLVALGNAILNNDSATYEKLREEYADLTRGVPRAPAAPAQFSRPSFETKAEAAEALVAFLTDGSGYAGNTGSYVDVNDEDGGDDHPFEIDNGEFGPLDELIGRDADHHGPYGSVDRLRDLVKAYYAAEG